MHVSVVPSIHLNLPVLHPPEGFHHMQDNHGDDMYAIELVPMGRFEAEQNVIYEDDPLAERMPSSQSWKPTQCTYYRMGGK